MDKDKISEKLNEVFGDKTVRLIIPKQFLSGLEKLLEKQNEALVEQIKANKIPPELVDENKKTRELLVELRRAVEENRVDKVQVSNFPEYPKFPEIKIPEQKEVKIPPYPTKINLVEPEWYQKVHDKLVSFLADGFRFIKKSFAEDLDSHMKKEKAIAVRLVDAEGKTFYNSVFYGGGGSVATSSGGDATAANQVTMIGHLSTIIGHVDGLEALLGTIDTDTGNIATSVASIDSKTPALGQALAAGSVPVVLTAAQLTTLTPPAAITGFATSAKQDTIIGHLDGVEGLLTTIDADTGTIAGAVSGTEMQVDVITMPTTTVQATNFDIRDLTSASDSVLIYGSDDGGTTKRIIKTDSGGAIQVDLEVASVTVTSISAGDNNIGNVDIVTLPGDVEADIDQIRDQIDLITPDIEEIRADADSIRIATELIDDAIFVDDTATHSTGSTKGMGIMAVAVPTDVSVSANDIGMPAMSTDRRLYFAPAAFSGTAIVDTTIYNATQSVSAIAVAAFPTGSSSMEIQGTETINSAQVGKPRLIAGLDNAATKLVQVPTVTTDNVTAINMGMEVMPAVSRASASATTAGRSTRLQVQSTTGALFVGGGIAHDGGGSSVLPLPIGGFSSAAAPTDVNADTDVVRAWFLRNGAQATVITAAGALIGGDATNGLDVDVTRVSGNVTVINSGTFATQVDGAALTALQLIDDPVFADDAAFTLATSKVMAAGKYAVAHGSNPDAADAGDAGISIMNRHRIPFMLGGHPNIVGLEYMTTGSQTNDPIIDSISSGTKIVITQIDATLDGDTTVNVKVRIGFGASAVPTEPTTGNSVTGMVLSHPDLKAGSGLVKGDGSGIIAIGGDGEELRITCDAPTSGQLTVMVSYFTIES